MSSFIVYLHSFVVYYIFSHYRIDYLVYLSKQASFYLIMILLKLALINRLFLMQPVSISSLVKDFMKLFHYYWANFLIFLSFYFFTDKNMLLSIEKKNLKNADGFVISHFTVYCFIIRLLGFILFLKFWLKFWTCRYS